MFDRSPRAAWHTATVWIATVTAAACGGSSSPTGPTGQACRTFAAAYTSVQTVSLGNESAEFWRMNGGCRWTADRLTCTEQYAFLGGDCQGEPGASTRIVSYRSAADFVDEVAAVPPVPRALSVSVQTPAGRCPSPSDSTYTYADGRLARVSGRSALNLAANAERVYTAWDSVGRPTEGTFSNFLLNGPISITHDTAARTTVERSRFRDGQWEIEQTTSYDQAGTVVGEIYTDAIPGEVRPRYVTATSVMATDRVCK